MKTFLVSAGLIAGSFLTAALPVAPAMALESQVCEGTAYYCEQFAYNCTMNNGRFTNLRPDSGRQVSYACELPAGVSADLFESNVAGTYVTPVGSDDDNSSSDSSSGDGGGNDNSGGGNDGGGGTGTTGGDDGQGNIL